ncbi:tRNA synthetases class II family protein [Theileria parva strain Muguga]|uniref:tRNA synthetases class II family protein n=1 Tax=Theileria parva strain Muguga TaxID=333668 RepID=UPI001C61941B|nr:tRNA synthetases class II family protein [Theileria parva strain Muguga]EAN31822.2 tRNA synthetases class II family protein [Theileria parva strain Muguga]
MLFCHFLIKKLFPLFVIFNIIEASCVKYFFKRSLFILPKQTLLYKNSFNINNNDIFNLSTSKNSKILRLSLFNNSETTENQLTTNNHSYNNEHPQYLTDSYITNSPNDVLSSTDETADTSLISSLCSYDESPHLLKQIKSRLDHCEVLTKKFKVNPYPEVKPSSDYSSFSKVISENESLTNGEEADRFYKVYGRVESVRFDGHFIDIVNSTKDFGDYATSDITLKGLRKDNKLQVMFRLEEPILVYPGNNSGDNQENDTNNNISENKNYQYSCKDFVELIDIGDVVELYGNVKKTNLGEISIIPKRIKFLSKCLIPPPSKQHGLKDIETRYRLRHLDLLTNELSRYQVLKRFQIIAKIRRFLCERGFVEVDTPILNHYTSGDLAEPFETYYKRLNEKVKLRIAPEFSIKKIFMGLPLTKVFEIGKCFRNEGSSLRHSPEFTMIEIYQKMADYNTMIKLLEDLINSLLSYGFNDDAVCDNVFEVKWRRAKFSDLIKEYTGVDITSYNEDELLDKFMEMISKTDSARSEQIESSMGRVNWGSIANEIFEKFVVPNLTYPVHVTHFPTQVSPLTYFDEKSANNDGSNEKLFSNRFESYLGGMEIANSSTEQCNPLKLSKSVLDSEISEVKDNNLKGKEVDKEFLNAAFCGMEPMAGLGIGVDRLIMYITKAKNIKEIQPLTSLKRL